jgi:DNA-binding SARP family transcriptional activator
VKSPCYLTDTSSNDIFINLSNKGLPLFFEGHIPALAQQIQQLLPAAKPPLPLRISLLVTLLQSDSNKQLEALYSALYAEKDYEACCACVGGAISLIWEKGGTLRDYTPWLKRGETLLTYACQRPLLAQSYLLLQKGLAEMTGSGNLNSANQCYQQQRILAEKADSPPLMIVGSSGHAYTLCWSGNLSKAEFLLLDMEPHLANPCVSPLFVAQHQITLAIVRTIQGKTEDAISILSKVLEHPLFPQSPPSLQLLTLNHLLETHIVAGNLPETKKIAEQIRQLAVPTQMNFHRCYLNFSLGEAALAEQRPQKALSHAEEAIHRADIGGHIIGARMSALLYGQALSDMRRDDEALQHFDWWIQQWVDADYNLIAALGYLEVAAIYARKKDRKNGQEFWEKAHGTLPIGEKMFHMYRSVVFYANLKEQLFSSPADFKECDLPVRVTCLGKFSLQINGEKFHNQNWRGRQTKLLLKALITLGGKEVPASTLSSLLWPDADGDNAINSLNVTLNRLRKVGSKKTGKTIPWVIVQNQKLSLKKDICCVDALIFQQQITTALKMKKNIPSLKQAVDLYSGNYLEGDADHSWVFSFRNRLLGYYIRGVLELTKQLTQKGETTETIRLLEQAIGYDPANENLYLELMRVYDSEKNLGKALDTYERAQKFLVKKFNASPSPPLQDLAYKLGLKL